ncbi:MAG: YggS family pyridoxal phosphate-dependent enzyme [Proteobacteria bacterium]|jgi:PLP dependent protein|nr:YggS family pyridoxal phosphate-dependent enzyme [Pseudomonadota bacterium]
MTTIAENLEVVRRRIAAACEAAGRREDSVRLLAVSKTKPESLVREALGSGQTDFGENYLKDAIEKIDALPTATWHFIGHIQSNKTRQIASRFDWVHSLASLKVARRLNAQRERDVPLNVLVQVNVSDDSAKDGVRPDEAGELIDQIRDLPQLSIRGLMTITEQTDDTNAQRLYFRQLAGLLGTLRGESGLESLTELSMGMSGDLELAIAEGATWVRVGTAIFGSRSEPAR